MCCGGGGGTQKVVQQTDSKPWSGVQPYLKHGFGTARSQLDTALGQGPVGMSPWTTQGLNQIIATAQQPGNATQTALATLTGTAGGDYLAAGNPYYQQAYATATRPMIDQWRSEIAPGIDSAFSAGGRLGSGQYALARNRSEDTLARALGDVAAGMGYQMYDDERQRQMQAAALAPGFQDLDAERLINAGQAFQGQQMYEQQYPMDMLTQYMNMLQGGLSFGSTSSTSKQPVYSNPASSILGGALGIGSLLGGSGGLLGLFG